MKLGFKAETTRNPSAITTRLRLALGASMIVLALSLTSLALAQTQPPAPAPATNTTGLPTAADATNVLTQALGAGAPNIIQALGGDPVAAMNAFTNGNATSLLTGALGGNGAVNALTQAMGAGNAIAAMTGALGQNGSLNALISAAGGNNAVSALAGSLLGNSSAVSAIQSVLGGNTQGLQALTSFLGGNTGALGALTSALGGSNGALGALTNALGVNGALSSLTGALGVDGALGALTGALGVNGALNALTGALGGQINQLLGGLGLGAVCGVAPLTGTFATNACAEAADNRSIEYAQEEPGGREVARTIEGQYTDRIGPDMRDAAAQVSAGITNQTRQIGTNTDAVQANEARRDAELQDLDSRKGLQPHDQSCALPTNGPALAQTQRAGAELSRAMVQNFTRRVNPTPDSPASKGYGAVIRERYESYCKYFIDPEDNNGITACTAAMQEAAANEENAAPATAPATGQPPAAPTPPAATPPAAATPQDPEAEAADAALEATAAGMASVPNGDIDIEGILLKDTVDFADTPTRLSAEAILDNLVQLKPYPKLSEEQLKSAAGVEWTVKKERLETLRKLSADVIAGMISRRVGIPIPDSVGAGSAMNPQEGGPPGECRIPNAAGAPNQTVMNEALRRQGQFYGARNSAGRIVMTYCQRFVKEASQRQVPLRGSAGSALAAWNLFRNQGIAQPVANGRDTSRLAPGDLLYFRGSANGTKNSRIYGHTGIFQGNERMCHVYSGAKVMCGPIPWRNYILLGYVRPSGASTDVGQCEFNYNNGTQPGQPTTTASGPNAGAPTGQPASTQPRDTTTPTAATPPPVASSGSTTSRGDYAAFLSALAQKESGGGGCRNTYHGYSSQGNDIRCMNYMGCMGRYQFCPAHNGTINKCLVKPTKGGSGRNAWTRIQGWKECNLSGHVYRPGSTRDFMENADMQQDAVFEHMSAGWDSAPKAKLCQRIKGGVLYTHSGALAARHLGCLESFLRNGRGCSDGATYTRDYVHRFGGYTVPFGTGNCQGDMVAEFGAAPPSNGMISAEYGDYYTPPPPRPVRDVIREIRQRAGIPDAEIGKDPSYNEIMLAMTKERFFDPRFFTEIISSTPAMQHNEVALNAYISMTLKDIEMLQEQINALVAARASLRIDELDRKNK